MLDLYPRLMAPVVKDLAKFFPVITITGPRQSGKTTLAKTLFSHLPYVLLEDLDTKKKAQEDPRGFLEKYQGGAIFDEVQNVPELVSYLLGIADASPRDGRFILTGSQNFTLSNTISQSLAGRTAVVTLLPLSLKELNLREKPMTGILKGGYPSIHRSNIPPTPFFSSYLQTYIERDIRQLRNVEDLGQFQNFLKLCAGRIGQVVNFQSLAQDANISNATARKWLNVLEASYIVFSISPFYKNFSKRLIKAPKLYFYDTGLACSLLGIENETQLESHYLRGGLYENLVILEVLKERLNASKLPNLYFWRDQTGHEIDLIGEWSGMTHAMEIKGVATFKSEQTKNLEYLLTLDPSAKGYLIYNGVLDGAFKSVELVPLKQLDVIFKE